MVGAKLFIQNQPEQTLMRLGSSDCLGTDLGWKCFTRFTFCEGKIKVDTCENLDINQRLFNVGVEVLQGNHF